MLEPHTAQLEFGRAIRAFEFSVRRAQMRLAALQLRDRALQIGDQKLVLHDALLERGRLARVLLCLLRELDCRVDDVQMADTRENNISMQTGG